MTTKYRIIFGFSFMVLLLAALGFFGYSRLKSTSTNFDIYRADARTAVNANAADALMREAKSNVNDFFNSLDPALIDMTRTSLQNSLKYMDETLKAETDSASVRQLNEQASQIKKAGDLAQSLKGSLLNADREMRERVAPLESTINDQLTTINHAAAAADNAHMLGLVDDAYSSYADFRVATRVYNPPINSRTELRPKS